MLLRGPTPPLKLRLPVSVQTRIRASERTGRSLGAGRSGLARAWMAHGAGLALLTYLPAVSGLHLYLRGVDRSALLRAGDGDRRDRGAAGECGQRDRDAAGDVHVA